MSQVWPSLPLSGAHKNSHPLTSKILLWSMQFLRKGWLRALLQLSPVLPTPPCLSLQSPGNPMQRHWCSSQRSLCLVCGVLRGPGSADSCQRDGGGPGGDLCHLATMESNLTFGKISLYCAQNLLSTRYTLLLSCVTPFSPSSGLSNYLDRRAFSKHKRLKVRVLIRSMRFGGEPSGF